MVRIITIICEIPCGAPYHFSKPTPAPFKNDADKRTQTKITSPLITFCIISLRISRRFSRDGDYQWHCPPILPALLLLLPLLEDELPEKHPPAIAPPASPSPSPTTPPADPAIIPPIIPLLHPSTYELEEELPPLFLLLLLLLLLPGPYLSE